MSTPYTKRPTSPLSPQLILHVYIPSTVAVLGVWLVQKEWLPFAFVIPAVLVGLHVYGNGRPCWYEHGAPADCYPVAKKALRPDIYQNFRLKEKTEVSHNVAMYILIYSHSIRATDAL